MTTWYRTRWHDSSSADLAEVEVVKTTDACVYLADMPGRRSAKRSGFENYFETREEAVAFVKNSLRRQIDRHQEHIDRLNETLAKFA